MAGKRWNRCWRNSTCWGALYWTASWRPRREPSWRRGRKLSCERLQRLRPVILAGRWELLYGASGLSHPRTRCWPLSVGRWAPPVIRGSRLTHSRSTLYSRDRPRRVRTALGTTVLRHRAKPSGLRSLTIDLKRPAGQFSSREVALVPSSERTELSRKKRNILK